MKKMLILTLTLAVLMLGSVTASAESWQNDRYHHSDGNWHQTHHNDYQSERDLPFKWRDHYDSIREHHRLERIHDREWGHRFPGLHPYRMRDGEGFWHHGRYVTDAVLFFNDEHRLVSIGYIADGVFIQFREDHDVYENHDSFFLAWWQH